MTVRRADTRRAFTLVELTLSMAVMVVLMGGIASALVLASRALPADTSPQRWQNEAYHATDSLIGDLYAAESFTVRTATAVEFTVADRNADGSSETIRYEWSGVKGEPLTRKYNTDAAANVVENVQAFNLSYLLDTVGKTVTQDVSAESGETLLASFDGWAGLTGNTTSYPVNAAYWLSEYFEVVPDPTATELIFTRAEVRLFQDGSGAPASVTLGVHRSLADGSRNPGPTAIGTAGSIPGTSLTTSPTWLSANFIGATVTDLARTDYCLVLKASDTALAWAECLYSKSAPTDTFVQKWTTDGGAVWNPKARLQDEQDLRFRVWGIYRITSSQNVTTYRYFLRSIGASLQVGTIAAAGVETSVQVLNMPEVTGP